MHMKKNKTGMSIGKDSGYLLLLGGILVLLCTFFLSNFDCEAIVRWGYGLLECIRTEQFGDFPRYVTEVMDSPTNYTLFVNGITALWLSPMYLLLGNTMANSLLFYEIWYKVLLVIVLIADVKLLYNILWKLGFDREKAETGCGMFVTSSITLLAVLGKGQIDCYGLLFALIAMDFFLRRKYVRMSVFLGLALLVKPLFLWLIVPFLLLLIEKEKMRVIKHAVIVALPFLADKAVTLLLMPEYIEYSKEVSKRMEKYFDSPSIFEQMFLGGIKDVLPFWLLILIVCFTCYYLAMHGKVGTWHWYVFLPLPLIFWGIFINVSYQWFIYVLPFLIMMGLQMKKKSDAYLLMLGLNGGLTAYFMVAEAMAIMPTLFGDIVAKMSELQVTVMRISQNLRPYMAPAGKTVFFTVMLVIVGVFALEQILCRRELRCKVGTERKNADGENDAETEEGLSLPLYEKVLLFVQPLPVIIYLLITAIVTVK